MDHRPDGDITNGKAVACLNGRCRTGIEHLSRLNTLGSDDVAALTIGVEQQCNVCGPVGVVFNALDLGRDAIFIALKVDLAIVLLMTTTNMTRGNAAQVIPAASLGFLL